MEQSHEKSQEITRMLQEWSGGKQEALDALLPLVYAELRRQASRYLRRERPDHSSFSIICFMARKRLELVYRLPSRTRHR